MAAISRIVDQKAAAAAYEAVQDDARELAVQSDRLRADRFPNDAARAKTENFVRDLRDRIATAARSQGEDEAAFLEAVRQGLQRASGGRSVAFADPKKAAFKPIDGEDRRLSDEVQAAQTHEVTTHEKVDRARRRLAVLEEMLESASAGARIAADALARHRAGKEAA